MFKTDRAAAELTLQDWHPCMFGGLSLINEGLRRPLTFNDELLGVSFEILLSYRIHCLGKASFGHKSVNVTEFVGA